MARLLFAFLLMFSTAAFAAVPKDLQQSLQKQFAQMKQEAKGRLSTEGDLKVDGDTIVYPAMKIMVLDMKSYWSVPSMTLTFTGSLKDGKIPFTLQLPKAFEQDLTDGTAVRTVTLNTPNIVGDWSQKENTIARLSGSVASVTWNDISYGTITIANDVAIQATTNFTQGDKVDVLAHLQTKQFSRSPESFASSLMPLQSSVTGTIKSLPKALVVFGALVPIPGLQSTLAQMGTTINIDNLNLTTANGATLKGNGWFKAAVVDSPLPVSGHMNLEWQNLSQVLTSLQQGFSAGGAGVDRGQTAQSMVLLMVLQGMGKAVGQTTNYMVDLTPEGRVLLNSQDVTAMFVGDHSLLRFFQPKQKVQATQGAKVPGQGDL